MAKLLLSLILMGSSCLARVAHVSPHVLHAQDIDSALFHAAASGRADEVKQLLAKGANAGAQRTVIFLGTLGSYIARFIHVDGIAGCGAQRQCGCSEGFAAGRRRDIPF